MKISVNIRNKMKGLLAAFLILCMVAGNSLAAYAATQEATAVSVHVLRSDGTVELRKPNGRILPLVEGMRLYHGYQITTQESSYAYMALDETKLATLDAVSDMELERKGDDLALMLNSGKLFFDVSAKLSEEETMNIHTSNVALGIRGTSGLVEIVDSRHTRVWLFEGQIDGTVTNQINEQKKEIHMVSGMVADFYVYNMDHAGDKCDIIVRNYHESEVPGFVLREMKKNLALVERIRQNGGGDFYPYLERAEEQLLDDETQMHERLEALRQAYEKQPYWNHTLPVFPTEDTTDDSDGGSESGKSSPATGPAAPGIPIEQETPTEAEVPTESEEPTEPAVYENATLLSGSQINQKFQELLNYADTYGLYWNPFRITAYAGTADLKAIRYASEAPSADLYTVTLEASGSPVYAWYQSGTIYLYSDAPEIQLAADSSGLLNGFYALTDISGLEKFGTANVTNLSNAFSMLQSLTDFSPVSGWDVSSVTDLSYAFSGCTSMTDLSHLSSWDTGQVTDLSYTFAYNTALTSVDGIADWNTSSVTVLDSIFSGCTGLMDASSLSSHSTGSYMAWDVKATFKNAEKAEQFLNTGLAADTSYSGYPDWFMKMYRFIGDDGSTELYTASIPMDVMELNTALQNQLAEKAPEYLKGWNTSADGSGAALGDNENGTLILEDMSFYYQPLEATLVTGADLKDAIGEAAHGADYVHEIQWSDVPPADGADIRVISTADSDSEVVCWYEGNQNGGIVYLYGYVKTVYLNPNSSEAFSSFEKLTNIAGLARLDCSKVTDLSFAFYYSYRLTDLSPIADWNTSNVTSLESTFASLDQTDNFNALAKWDTGNVVSMKSTFGDHSCKNFSGLAGWDTSNVRSFQGMFATGYGMDTFSDVEPLTNWKTGNATTMRSMFSGCDSLLNVDGLSGWDVSQVTDMSGIFNSCKSLRDITGLQGWKTDNVQDMSRAFWGCEELTNLQGLEGWNVSSVTNMLQTFYGLSTLTGVSELSDWNPEACLNFQQMFENCGVLKDASPLDAWKLNEDATVMWMFDSGMDSYPWWYQNGKLITDQVSTLTLDAGAGTVELCDMEPVSVVTFYTSPQQMSEETPDPEILSEEYLNDAVELPEAEHETAVFQAWNTSKDGSGTTYNAGEVFTLEGETTLYAVWEGEAPSDATPSDAALSDATPSDATPSDVTPSDATPSDAMPSDATPSNAEPAADSESEAPAIPEVPKNTSPLMEEGNISLEAFYLESQNEKKESLLS